MNRNLRSRSVAVAAVLLAGLLVIWFTTGTQQASSEPNKSYLLESKPEDAKNVLAIREVAEDQQEVVVEGRIGGRTNPWIKDAAAFSIVDSSLKPCNEIPGDACETPWDYCCEANLPKSTLLVMVYDVEGKVVKQDARSLLGVKELDTVVIQGKAERDKAGNVTIVASKVYVAPDKKKETTQ